MATLRFVLGDQLDRQISALRDLDPSQDVVLMVEAQGEAANLRHSFRFMLRSPFISYPTISASR